MRQNGKIIASSNTPLHAQTLTHTHVMISLGKALQWEFLMSTTSESFTHSLSLRWVWICRNVTSGNAMVGSFWCGINRQKKKSLHESSVNHYDQKVIQINYSFPCGKSKQWKEMWELIINYHFGNHAPHERIESTAIE